MELRQYWQIIRRRIWVPVVLVLLVAGFSLLTRQTPPTTYTASLRFVVSVMPEQVPDQFNYDGYYAGISSEFVADDLSAIVGSQAFAADVNRHLAEQGSALQVPPHILSGQTFADKQHRILQVNLSWSNPDELAEIGQAVVTTIETDSEKYLGQLAVFGGLITVIDENLVPAPIPPSLTQRLDLPVRLILAAIAGVALIFLWHYLDTSVQSAAELEALGINVLGEIPK